MAIAREDLGFQKKLLEQAEKMAAAARIPGNYFRRETRQSEPEILLSRLIDRTLRVPRLSILVGLALAASVYVPGSPLIICTSVSPLASPVLM